MKLNAVQVSTTRVWNRHWHFALIVTLVLPLYAITGRWGAQGNLDALSAALPAYQVIQEGELDLSSYPTVADNLEVLDRWFVETPAGLIVSNRAPGLIAVAIPGYALFNLHSFTNGPATAVALLTTILAIFITWEVLIRLVGLNKATVGAITLALGTTTWWVSSSELWPHGPGQLWAAIAILSLSASSAAGAGWAFAASVTTRPLTALFALFSGASESWRQKSWSPAIRIGSISAIGLAAVVTYNRAVFGLWTVRGGYSADFTSGAMRRFTIGSYLGNVWDMFIGLPNGVLTTSPILGVALIGAIVTWSRIPGWAKSTAFAGFGYLLVHAALNRASGGSVIFYRYPLEAIVLAAPLLALGASRLWDQTRIWRKVIVAALVTSIALQMLQVFVLSCSTTFPVLRTCLL